MGDEGEEVDPVAEFEGKTPEWGGMLTFLCDVEGCFGAILVARSVFDKCITCCVRGTSVALYLYSYIYFPFTGFEEGTYCLSGLLVFHVTSICQGPSALSVPSHGRITARSSRKTLIPSPFLKPFLAIFQRQPSREPNMSSFRLLNLPPELRDPIHESILIPREHPHAARLVSSRRVRQEAIRLFAQEGNVQRLPSRTVRPEPQAPHFEVAALNSASCCPAKIPVRAVSGTSMPFARRNQGCPILSMVFVDYGGVVRLSPPCLWSWIRFGSQSTDGR